LSNPVTYSEPELIKQLREREEFAYSYLYDHYGSALYGIILRIVLRTEVAEDVLQEVFIKIYYNIDQYEPAKGKLYTWMLHIAYNLAIDTLRSKGFRQSKEIQPLDNDVNVNAVYSYSVPEIDHIGLDKVVSELSEDHRKIIDLAYFRGYTQEEIARELSIPLGTVKTRVRSALIHLRSLLNIK
jgi:RNA polymerase sigma-70 factor (ECF subfamily)